MYYNPYLQGQQYPMQPQYPQPQMPVTNQDDRIWVQGEGSAQAYLVAPNSFVRLWDSTKQVFYEKRADASGKPSMVVYEYRNTAQPETNENSAPVNNYGEEISKVYERLNALEERMKEYEQQSYDDDAGVYEVPEQLPRRSPGRAPKINSPRQN